MSFKIFSLQLTGKIKSTAAVEKKRAGLEADYAAFRQTESSDELKAFLALQQEVNSVAFKKARKEMENLSFKGNKEEKQELEFKKLKKSAAIRKYLRLKESDDLARFEKERDGENMKRFYALQEYVKEGAFAQEKLAIVGQRYKGSPEEKHRQEFQRLEKSAGIRAYKELHASDRLKRHEAFEQSESFKKYHQLKNAAERNKADRAIFRSLQRNSEIKAWFRFERSKKLRLYRETAESHELERYRELRHKINSDAFKEREAFLKDKKKFEKSEAFEKYSEYKRLAADDTVKFVLKFARSAKYKNYLDVKDSFDLKRYYELEELINSDAFKQQKAWLLDKKRWEKSDDGKKYQHYLSEKEKAAFVQYFRYKDAPDFDFLKNWTVAFEDDFSAPALDRQKWSTCLKAGEATLGKNYALPGDRSIFTSGANLITGQGLKIRVKKEPCEGVLWNASAGFIPETFDYSAGLLSGESTFVMQDGIVEVKLKFNPVKSIVSSLYLCAGDNGRRVNVLEMGKRNTVGFLQRNANGKAESVGLDISNLKKGDYIFTLEKQGAAFTWKINGTTVLQQNNADFDKPMHLEASSMVVDEVPASMLPADFEVKWLKCYVKK